MKEYVRDQITAMKVSQLIQIIESRINTIKECYSDINEINNELISRTIARKKGCQ